MRNRVNVRLAAVAIIIIGAAFTVANLGLAIVRNSLVYATLTANLRAHHFRLWEVCGAPSLAHDKACGFPALAAPLFVAFGANVGLKLASFVGTALFVWAAALFLRHFHRRFGLSEQHLPLALAISCFNPLVIYQFWSAYPDTLFFAAFVYSFVLLDRLLCAEEARVATAVAYFLILVGSIFVKHWGLLLFPLHTIYVYWYRERFAAVDGRRRALLVGAALAGAFVFVALGRLGINPLLNLQVNEGQYDEPVPYLKSVLQLAVFVVTTVGVLLLLILRVELHRRDAALALCAIVYVHALMVYEGASYNARYYIGVLPLGALYFVRALESLRRPRLRVAMVALFLVANGAEILFFNSRTVHTTMSATLPRSWLRSYGYFDSYRMRAHLQASESIAHVNATLPSGALLYYVSSYYGDAAHHVYEDAKLFRPDLRIRYLMAPPTTPASDETFFVFMPGSESHPSQLLAVADWLGQGLFRVAARTAPPG